MRILVCGARTWADRMFIERELINHRGLFENTVIEGDCNGADRLAGYAALSLGMDLEVYPAKWLKYGRSAGRIRNQEMLDRGKPELVLAFHDDLEHSRGTKDMIRRAKRAGIPVKTFRHEAQQSPPEHVPTVEGVDI